MLLDAECAWYGDPAFDAAFCLNHLVLKSIHLPTLQAALLRAGGSVCRPPGSAHLPAALRRQMEARVAALLPCLMLARVDGKSPVEYLTPASRSASATCSLPLIRQPVVDLGRVFAALRS